MIKYAVIAVAATLTVPPLAAQTFGATKAIWQQRSLYRNIIVLEGNGHRCLTFGRQSARQSCIETGKPSKLIFGYTQRIFDALTHLPSMSRILIIGIGGGSLPTAVRAAYPNVWIDAVELDSEVINVAKRFFSFRPDSKMRIFAGDGRIFVRQEALAGTRYDAVILDAFDKDYIPEHMATVEFLAQVRSTLAPGGIVLANTYSGTRYQAHEEATYQKVYGQVFESRLFNGNRIILAGSTAEAVTAHLPSSGAVRVSGARPLTDRFAPANALLIH